MSVATMMAEQVVKDIENYMRPFGGQCSEWYVGITPDVHKRLFVDHNVSMENDDYIHRDCGSNAEARAVEDYFYKQGYDGTPGGVDDEACFVYAYQKSRFTHE